MSIFNITFTDDFDFKLGKKFPFTVTEVEHHWKYHMGMAEQQYNHYRALADNLKEDYAEKHGRTEVSAIAGIEAPSHALALQQLKEVFPRARINAVNIAG